MSSPPARDLYHYLERLARVPLYIVEMTPTDAWNPSDPHFAQLLLDHLTWLAEREVDGTLFLAGPLDLERGLGPGLMVLRAETLEAAAALADDEPFGRAGWRDNRARTWQVNEGHIRLTVDLLTARISLH